MANAPREHRAALERLRRADLDEAWRALRTKRRLMVTVVGDVSQAEVRGAVQHALGAFATDHKAGFDKPEPKPGASAALAVLDYPDVPTWHVNSVILGPEANTPEYTALWLGLNVLGARLFDQIRDAEGLAYTTGAKLSFYRQSFGSIWMSTPQPARAFAITREIVAELKREGPTESELTRARQAMHRQLLDDRATPAGLASSLADWQLTSGSYSDAESYLESAGALTPTEVAAALTSYLRDAKTVAAGSGEPVLEADLATL